MVSPFLPDDRKVDAIRAALPATSAGIYLNTGTAGPLPAETAAAMAEAADWELRTGRGAAALFEARGQRLDEARARHKVRWEWIKGHAGHPENERADELARAGMKPFKPKKAAG